MLVGRIISVSKYAAYFLLVMRHFLVCLRRSKDSLDGCAADDSCVHRVAQAASRIWTIQMLVRKEESSASEASNTMVRSRGPRFYSGPQPFAGAESGRHVLGPGHVLTAAFLLFDVLRASVLQSS